MANRQHRGDLFRPVQAKPVQTGIAWSSGGSFNLAQAIDLSLPIRGLRMKFSGRLVIGTAAFTTVNPEGFLNLISSVLIQGTNARQKGNVTLYNVDLATQWTSTHMFALKGHGLFTIATGGAGTDASVPSPDTPFPAAGTAVPNHSAGFINGATGTYDWRITCDFPFHPFESNSLGRQPEVVPAFLVRNEEWKDSLSIQMTYGAQAGAGGVGALGTSAGTTTVTFTAYNSGAGTPSVDWYSLPIVMGMNLKDMVLPGIISRVTQPVLASTLTAAGTNVVLMNLQKQPTTRVIVKTGTLVTAAPAFTALSDLILTTIGLLLGGNRNVRNKIDTFIHKHQIADFYDREPIQGYLLLDFMESGNPDSAFPGQDVGDGATLQVIADVPGTANAYGLVVQEQVLHIPTGALYA